jgi:organic hydroperoxide reductase OsmC/OhrA
METVAATTHTFDVSLEWNTDTNNGIINSGKRHPLQFGSPPEFHGNDIDWSPEHMLLASLSGCYLTTLFSFAKLMRVNIVSCKMEAKVEFEKKPVGFEATKYFLSPTIKFENAPDKNVQDNLLGKAKKYCFVSNSVKGEVIVNPVVL